jgi:hypothetical protein
VDDKGEFEFRDYQASVVADLQRVLLDYTDLDENHPFIKLGIEAALKHASYCALDIMHEEDESINYTEEFTFVDMYSRNMAEFILDYINTKVSESADGFAYLSADDYTIIKNRLEKLSRSAFREGVSNANAVRSGEMEPLSPQDEEKAEGNYTLADWATAPQWTVTSSNAKIERLKYEVAEKDR